MTSKILPISAGWKFTGPKSTHNRAPLISRPKMAVKSKKSSPRMPMAYR